MVRAIVIGADGFLGGNLVKRLTMLGGWEVFEVGRAFGDLSQPGVADAALAAAPPCEVLFHVVTRQRTGHVQFGIQGEMLAINARIHLNVLEAWRTHQPQAKLVSTGSSCAYPESDHPLTEDMFGAGTVHPSVTGYALAKQVLARGAQTYAEQYGLKHLHCILATLYGPGDHKTLERSHFVGAMLDRAAEAKRAGKTELGVWGDPSAVREVLYVDDQIDAILAATAVFENQIINCAAEQPVKVIDVAEAVVEALQWPARLAKAQNSFSGASYKVLNSSKFLKATGWRPQETLASGLKKLVAAEYQ